MYLRKVRHSRISTVFPGIGLVSIIYVRYCQKMLGKLGK